jgi:ABC-2 type transport system ATP-binding protein
MTAMPETVIDVRHLTKRFGGRAVVDDVSMTVNRGEIVGFLGPNGSGKTTTIRMMCGLLTLDEGEGEVLGHDLRTEARAIKDRVGYMTQKFSLYEDLTIAENLALVAGLYRLPDPRAAVRDTLATLGLTSRRDQLAGKLSGGWKQRLALAACIMHAPRLLLLDEPTAGMGPEESRQMVALLGRLKGRQTLVLIEHDMDAVFALADRISVLVYGQVIATGPPDEIAASPAVREAYLGDGGEA